MQRRLTDKQKVWLERYLANGFNGSEAARFAGYAHPRQQGHANLSKHYIRQEIERRFGQMAMSANEALARLSAIAQGSISDFLKTDVDGFQIDWTAVRTKGFLIKKVWETKHGFHIELRDPLRALELIGKHHGLFTEELVLSWRQEAEQMGFPPSELFDRMVAEIIADMTRKKNEQK